MLSAHLPSGYIAGRLLLQIGPLRDGTDRSPAGPVLWPAILGSVLPDIDMGYFYLFDGGRVFHHLYPTHWPLFWCALCLPAVFLSHIFGRTMWRNSIGAFFMGLMLHMVLDSIAAPLFWLMPFAPGRVELVQVPSNYSHWIISFVLHWTFLLEAAIWVSAGYLLVMRHGAQSIWPRKRGLASRGLEPRDS